MYGKILVVNDAKAGFSFGHRPVHVDQGFGRNHHHLRLFGAEQLQGVLQLAQLFVAIRTPLPAIDVKHHRAFSEQLLQVHGAPFGGRGPKHRSRVANPQSFMGEDGQRQQFAAWR